MQSNLGSRASRGYRSGVRSFQSFLEALESRRLFAATKIMPLGDSITEEFAGHATWRYYLYNQLVGAGYDVDFVGSMFGVNGGSPPNTNFDQNHEGHSGWRADEIQANISGWANTYKPDVVLLHIGTNDLEQNQSNSSTITEISGIIDNLRSVSPNVTILLAKIIPNNVSTSSTVSLNNSIATLAAQKNAAKSKVLVVDQYTGFNLNSDTYDGIHPTDSGDLKMANKWYSSLTGVLPSPPPPQPPPQGTTFLSSLNWTFMINGWGDVEKDKSNGELGATDGKTLTLNGTTYARGLGTHASSEVRYTLAGFNGEFRADIGVDDEVGNSGSVVFQVYVDNTLKYTSPKMTGASATQSIVVNVSGGQTLRLVVSDSGDDNAYDHADWANARLISTGSAAPNAPSGLSASLSGNQIDLSWTDASTDETGFRVQRKTGSGGTYAQIADLGAGTTTYSDTTVTAGNTYYYRVVAYNGALTSGNSNEANATVPSLPVPTAPGGLSATLAGAQINLAWSDNSSDETGFRIQRKTGSAGTYAQIADLGAGTVTYSDTGVSVGNTYYYRVLAYSGNGNSGFSNEASVSIPLPPPPPGSTFYLSDLSYTVVSNGWGNPEKDRSNGEQGATDGKTITLNGATYTKGIGTHAASEITYNLSGGYTQFLSDVGIDDEVGNNGSVVFQVYLDGVKAYDSGTMSGATATKSINLNVQGKTTLRLVVTDAGNGASFDHADWANTRLVAGEPVPAPAQPSGLAASLNGSKVDLTWTDNASNETGYRVERKLGASGTWGTVQTLAAGVQTYSDTSVLQGSSTYFYRVFAVNSGGDSLASNESSIITPQATQTWLSDLNWASATNGWGAVEKDKSNGEQGTGDGGAITIRNTTYAKGLGIHAASDIRYNLNGAYTSFASDIGVDNETGGGGSIVFQIYVDGVLKYDSGTVRGTDAIKSVLVSVAGANQLRLVVTNAGDGANYDHGDWAGARLLV